MGRLVCNSGGTLLSYLAAQSLCNAGRAGRGGAGLALDFSASLLRALCIQVKTSVQEAPRDVAVDAQHRKAQKRV